MRTRFAALAAAVLMLAGSAAFAADATTATGTVKSVADDKGSFVVTSKDGADTTVKVNDKTKYTLDKADSDFAKAVVVGNRAKVEIADGAATTVAARGPAKPKKAAAPAAEAAPAK